MVVRDCALPPVILSWWRGTRPPGDWGPRRFRDGFGWAVSSVSIGEGRLVDGGVDVMRRAPFRHVGTARGEHRFGVSGPGSPMPRAGMSGRDRVERVGMSMGWVDRHAMGADRHVDVMGVGVSMGWEWFGVGRGGQVGRGVETRTALARRCGVGRVGRVEGRAGSARRGDPCGGLGCRTGVGRWVRARHVDGPVVRSGSGWLDVRHGMSKGLGRAALPGRRLQRTGRSWFVVGGCGGPGGHVSSITVNTGTSVMVSTGWGGYVGAGSGGSGEGTSFGRIARVVQVGGWFGTACRVGWVWAGSSGSVEPGWSGR